MSTRPPEELLTEAFEAHHALLWGMSYRMLAVPAEADEVVQDTFLRALRAPPPDLDAPLRPWLVRVAMNLCRDRLRQRQRRHAEAGYPGVWLPGPVPAEAPAEDAAASPEARYQLAESASLAFLHACSALTPGARAVLLLREVYGLSVRETADVLELSEANVRTTLHRARRTLESYDARRQPLSRARQQQAEQVLVRLGAALAANSLDDVRALLAEDVRSLSDGGGTYIAARRPSVGRTLVARQLLGLYRVSGAGADLQLCALNGLAGLLIVRHDSRDGWAPLTAFALELDAEGLICGIYSQLSPDRLTAVAPA